MSGKLRKTNYSCVRSDDGVTHRIRVKVIRIHLPRYFFQPHASGRLLLNFATSRCGWNQPVLTGQFALPNLLSANCVLWTHIGVQTAPPSARYGRKSKTGGRPPRLVIRPFGLFRARGLLLPGARALSQTGLTHTRSLLSKSRHSQLVNLLRQLRLLAGVNLGLVPRLH